MSKQKQKRDHLARRFAEAVGSGQSFFVVRTDEWDEALVTLSKTAEATTAGLGWTFHTWDCDAGYRSEDEANAEKPKAGNAMATIEDLKAATAQLSPALGAIKAIDRTSKIENAYEDDRRPVVLVMRNLHKFWDDPRLIQTLQNYAKKARAEMRTIVALVPPGTTPPTELAPMASTYDHQYPKAEEFETILSNISFDGDVEVTPEQMNRIASASCGLTRQQAETAYSVSLIRKKAVLPEVVEECKNEILNADGMLKRWHVELQGRAWPTFADVGGQEALKGYLLRCMAPEARKSEAKRACVLLVGPPGTGKTLVAKALGNETGRKTYGLNLSANKSKFVGDSEGNARRMFSRLSAMNDVIAYIDEVNEQVEGGESEGHSVDKALRQYLMEWLDTHRLHDDVFVVMTANDMSKMHMALSRAGRVDKIFYVGLPGAEQKAKIWEIATARYNLEPQALPDDAGWAGVEIDACCAEASCFAIPLVEAAKGIIPSSVRVAEQIESLKTWAHNRVLDAETGEIFNQNSTNANYKEKTTTPFSKRPRRKVKSFDE